MFSLLAVFYVYEFFVWTVCMQYPSRPEEGIRTPRSGLKVAHEHRGVLELNPVPMQEQLVVLITKPSLQLHVFIFQNFRLSYASQF